MGAAENKQVIQRAFDAWAAGRGVRPAGPGRDQVPWPVSVKGLPRFRDKAQS
jgi:hypothetical protein